ncbi:MAG: zinc-dependent alcohol dehydrogenase [Planctomycetota bacterium]
MSETMLAAVLERPEQLSLLRIPVPRADEGQVVLRVEACGICGSDLRYLAGENPWAMQTLGSDKPNPPNMVLGHEVAGTIVQDPTGQRMGQRVVLLAYQACGTCPYCRRGLEHLCEHVRHHGHGAGWRGTEYNPGGLAELCVAAAGHAVPLPGAIEFEEATLLDGLAVALHASELARLGPGDTVAVLGSGPLGLLLAQVARASGACQVLPIDVAAGPLDMAQELGFEAIDASRSDASMAVLELTDAVGVTVCFDTVGTARTREQGLTMLRRSGRLVCLAGSDEPLGGGYTHLAGERAILTAANSPYRDLARAIDLARTDRVRLTPLVTHTFPLDAVERAFAVAGDRETSGAIKVVVQPAASA